MQLFGLVDANNFYVSCERVFRPDLRGRPVVVLSNNDGCVVSRSNESKAMGIRMGVPYYQVKDKLAQENVTVFSSNYALYADLSNRVMSLLSSYTPTLDIYSIDEAFMDLTGICTDSTSLITYCKAMVRHITKSTGIPVSLGVAPTRTLAKMASKFAKTYRGYEGVCLMETESKQEKALKLFPIKDVWGIGRHSLKKLLDHGIHTAWDFTQCPEAWVRKEFKITGVRTWRELKGESCITLDRLPHKKSICTSRSFADRGLDSQADVESAIGAFAAQCSRKLREQHTVCRSMTVFAYTSRFRTDLPQDMIYRTSAFQVPTNSMQELVAQAVKMLRSDWKAKGFLYKKAGVIVWEISDASEIQTDLFDEIDREKQIRLSEALDKIERSAGRNAVHMAVQDNRKSLKMKTGHISPQYTTDISDIIVLKVR